ncbi:MAG: hypothetical protein ABSB33_01605 [Tepidisphaeraceae bacterium]|jgi:hypothetical protein
MKQDKPGLDSSDPTADPSPRRIPAWARPPIFMYLTMVAAFAVAAIFVVYYVLRLGRPGR